MNIKNRRLEAIRLLISSRELSGQEDVLNALIEEGFELTQATLSRDLRQLKVAKAASMNGKYVYVLPNETMYKRVVSPSSIDEMKQNLSTVTINFSGNMGVIKTRPGYASAVAYDIDTSNCPEILGTIAGDDTIFIMIKEGSSRKIVKEKLSEVIPNIK